MTATGAGARGRSREMRLFAVAFALLQIVLQGTFAVSDGYAERASSHIPPVHTEAPGNTHHRLHDDNCVVCHVLASGSEIPRRVQTPWPTAARLVAVPDVPCRCGSRADRAGTPLPRAPPQV